ncbi:MAG: hypothetical protein V1728_00625 [Candidatus Micrarchaeota archaeon]
MLALFALLILCSFLSAQVRKIPEAVPGVDKNDMFVQNWHVLVFIGLAIAGAIVAIAYMAGEALNVQSAKAYAKAEAREFLVSAVMVVFILGSLVAFGAFAQTVSQSRLGPGAGQQYKAIGYCSENARIYDAGRPENLLYAQADWFLGCMPSLSGSSSDTYYYDPSQSQKVEQNMDNNMRPAPNGGGYVFGKTVLGDWPKGGDGTGESKGIMITHLTNIYISLFSLEFWLGPISTFGTSFYGVEGMVSSNSADFAPNAGLTPISEATITITDLIGVGIGVLFSQKVLLLFFHTAALGVFLPLGMGFRAVPFLRKTGTTIIALALVAYFIFPITIWINYNAYAIIYPAPPAKTSMQSWANYQTLMQMGSRRTTDGKIIGIIPLPDESPGHYEQRIRDAYGATRTAVELSTWEKIVNFVTGAWSNTYQQPGSWWESLKPGPGVSPGDMNIMTPARQLNVLGFMFVERLRDLLKTEVQVAAVPVIGAAIPPEYLFNMLADELHTSMQWFVLNMLFLLNTLIITITLFRDISLTLGGDPRIFGLSKLV